MKGKRCHGFEFEFVPIVFLTFYFFSLFAYFSSFVSFLICTFSLLFVLLLRHSTLSTFLSPFSSSKLTFFFYWMTSFTSFVSPNTSTCLFPHLHTPHQYPQSYSRTSYLYHYPQQGHCHITHTMFYITGVEGSHYESHLHHQNHHHKRHHHHS